MVQHSFANTRSKIWHIVRKETYLVPVWNLELGQRQKKDMVGNQKLQQTWKTDPQMSISYPAGVVPKISRVWKKGVI